MNHYKLPTPWIVSFSGGRTSAFMLRKMLDAAGGLPSDCRVVFANTGREHEATLRFVRECQRRWEIPIAWIERTFDEGLGFREVSFETASRNGEPFAQLIKKKRFLPNPVMRFCTQELKVFAMRDYLRSIGIEEASMAVGLRADEPRRVHKVHGEIRNGFEMICPIAKAGHTLDDVLRFWKTSSFDLELPNDDRAFGNCDLCFLKGLGATERVIESDPSRAQWWADQEHAIGGRFRKDRKSYSALLVQVRIQGRLFGSEGEDEQESISCTCTD